jgi:hypothetical protein
MSSNALVLNSLHGPLSVFSSPKHAVLWLLPLPVKTFIDKPSHDKIVINFKIRRVIKLGVKKSNIL